MPYPIAESGEPVNWYAAVRSLCDDGLLVPSDSVATFTAALRLMTAAEEGRTEARSHLATTERAGRLHRERGAADQLLRDALRTAEDVVASAREEAMLLLEEARKSVGTAELTAAAIVDDAYARATEHPGPPPGGITADDASGLSCLLLRGVLDSEKLDADAGFCMLAGVATHVVYATMRLLGRHPVTAADVLAEGHLGSNGERSKATDGAGNRHAGAAIGNGAQDAMT